MKILLAVTMGVVFSSADLYANQPLPWPQFRGANGSGVADSEQPPVEIGPGKNLRWKVSAPGGMSSPIVAGDKLIITAFAEDRLYTVAYDRAHGKEVWRRDAGAKEIEPFYKPAGSPAASTPVTDGKRIVSYFGSCGLICYDLNGNELWRYEMPTAKIGGNFGSGVSPILADGIVVLVRDVMQDAKVVAVDAETGKLVWETPRKSTSSYSTPVVWETPAGKLLAAAGHAHMAGYDLKSGEQKWTVTGLPSGCCPSPVTGDGLLFFAGWSPGGSDDPEFQLPPFDGMLQNLDKNADELLSREEVGETELKDFFDTQDSNEDGQISREEWDAVLKFMKEGKNIAFALKPGGKGDITETHVLWKKTKGLPYIPSAILYRGQYVMVKDGGIVTAYDAKSGERLYMKRAIPSGTYYASPVAANGHIYFTSLDDGTVTVLKAGEGAPKVVAENQPLGEKTAATPAIADDTLYVRTEKNLYAFGMP